MFNVTGQRKTWPVTLFHYPNIGREIRFKKQIVIPLLLLFR